jgi:hypothetical protein
MRSTPISEDPIPSKKVTTLLDLMDRTKLSAEFFLDTCQFFKYSSFISVLVSVTLNNFQVQNFKNEMLSHISEHRYFKYELLAKGAISKEDLPVFLTTWIDRSNSACMFSVLQQRTWTTSHLTGGAWYLECAPSFTPSFETELRKSRENVGESGIEMLDLQGIEDENERARAMKRRIEEDRKKALKVKEAEEKADQKEREKLEKSIEKSTKKGKKKMNPPPEPERKSPVAPSPTYESGSHAPTFSRGTKRDSSYEQLSQIPILTPSEDPEIQIQELILNASMEDVLGGDTEDFTPFYNDLKSFMLKVVPFSNVMITI